MGTTFPVQETSMEETSTIPITTSYKGALGMALSLGGTMPETGIDKMYRSQSFCMLKIMDNAVEIKYK